ncbi:hypothetical protein IT6_03880 [Methylacidiphilum caldifontis]|uniref:hypothetical protein n=1 Tax=Methylacidiphilum caldifontis TaxID=2795386 RepID=UPI001A8D5B4F|nr:hypothetical protein [Methylacidiphilum caldifontis]QSR89430.1 hypothetical protein IT6_03880 [Methylacidiphilum caldifontis]
MNTIKGFLNEEKYLFEIEALESRHLFAAAAIPHHLFHLNGVQEFSGSAASSGNGFSLLNINQGQPSTTTQFHAQINDPVINTNQFPIFLHLGVGGPQATLQIGELNLAKDLQPLLSGVNSVLNVVTGLTNDLLSPLLTSVLSII